MIDKHRMIVTIVTYMMAFFYFTLRHVEPAYLDALVPCGAYLFFTLSWAFAKKYDLKHIFKKKEDS